MIVEPVVCVILRCSRCNTPWLNDDTDSPALWSGLSQIGETFQRAAHKAYSSDVGGWRHTHDERYLCDDCHIVERDLVVEKPPLAAIDEATILRAQTEYARKVGQVAAYELLPAAPVEASGETR